MEVGAEYNEGDGDRAVTGLCYCPLNGVQVHFERMLQGLVESNRKGDEGCPERWGQEIRDFLPDGAN